MTTVTLTLTDFLLARIAEDEEWAKWAGVAQDEERSRGVAFVSSLGSSSVASAGRVLAQCEATRQIVAAHPMMPARPSTLGHLLTADGRKVSPYYRDGCCETCTAGGEYGGPANAETGEMAYCSTLRILAAIYADHPDYREDWRP